MSAVLTLCKLDPYLPECVTERREAPREDSQEGRRQMTTDRRQPRGRRVSDDLQQDVREALKLDHADHMLRWMQAIVMLFVAGVGSWIAVQVTLLYQKAPQIEQYMAATSRALDSSTQMLQAHNTELARLNMSQENIRDEVTNLRAHIATVQERLNTLERELARKGVM